VGGGASPLDRLGQLQAIGWADLWGWVRLASGSLFKRKQEWSRRTIHKNINEQNLHRVQRIVQAHDRADGDERQRSRRSTQLEGKEVLDVVEYRFA